MARWYENYTPIVFASKRMSKTEEKYKPFFLLEFAALKFGLDKSTNITCFPIKIETDCQYA